MTNDSDKDDGTLDLPDGNPDPRSGANKEFQFDGLFPYKHRTSGFASRNGLPQGMVQTDPFNREYQSSGTSFPKGLGGILSARIDSFFADHAPSSIETLAVAAENGGDGSLAGSWDTAAQLLPALRQPKSAEELLETTRRFSGHMKAIGEMAERESNGEKLVAVVREWHEEVVPAIAVFSETLRKTRSDEPVRIVP